MGVVVRHHNFHGGVRDLALVAPSLAFQAAAHAAALGAAETDCGCGAVFVVHLMQSASAQSGGLVGNAGHAEVLELDRVRRRECGSGEQAEDAYQRQQQRRQAHPQMVSRSFHKRKISFFEFPIEKDLPVFTERSSYGLWVRIQLCFRECRARWGTRRTCGSRRCRPQW